MARFAEHLALYSAAGGGTLVTLDYYSPGAALATSPLPPGFAELIGRARAPQRPAG